MLKPSSAPITKQSSISRRKVQSFLRLRQSKSLNLKEYVNKSYTLFRSEKYEQFLQKLGAKKEVYKLAAKVQPTLTLKKDGDYYILETTCPNFSTQIVKFKSGEIIDRKLHSGTIIKSLFEIKENIITEVQEWEDKEVTIMRHFLSDELVISMKANKAECFRHYKISTSLKPSIQTETSRRISIHSEVKSEVLASPPVESAIEREANSEEEIYDECY